MKLQFSRDTAVKKTVRGHCLWIPCLQRELKVLFFLSVPRRASVLLYNHQVETTPNQLRHSLSLLYAELAQFLNLNQGHRELFYLESDH